MYCVPCHGEGGTGNGPLARSLRTPPKNLADHEYLRRVTDADLAKYITEGVGSVHSSPVMPSWVSVLRNRDVADVITYLRSLETK